MSRQIIRHRLRRSLVLVSLVFAAMTVSVPAAFAACHAFTISASPTTVTPGGHVTVTVKRDGALNPSSVDVRTVDGSARSGQDYAGGRRTISFTTETEKSYTIATMKDSTPDAAETFRIELVPGSGSGCEINPNFTYGPPVTVTISASVHPSPTSSPRTSPAQPTPHASPAPTGRVQPAATIAGATARPTATATGPSARTSVADIPVPVTPLPAPTNSHDGTPLASARSGDSSGRSTGTIVIAMIVAAAVLAAAYYLPRLRRRRA
jgi:hypothetical protein